ncbi:MAG TPA: hypothetical protein VH477_05285 [Bryobacteraceae bacterium]|jgi:hypothetical protein
MLSLLGGLAVTCDFIGTVLVLADQVRARKDAGRREQIQNHITAIEIAVNDLENIPETHGAKVKGMDFDEAVSLTRDAAKTAIARNKQQLLDLKKQIEEANKVNLGYIAAGILILGVILHAVEAITGKTV